MCPLPEKLSSLPGHCFFHEVIACYSGCPLLPLSSGQLRHLSLSVPVCGGPVTDHVTSSLPTHRLSIYFINMLYINPAFQDTRRHIAVFTLCLSITLTITCLTICPLWNKCLSYRPPVWNKCSLLEFLCHSFANTLNHNTFDFFEPAFFEHYLCVWILLGYIKC